VRSWGPTGKHRIHRVGEQAIRQHQCRHRRTVPATRTRHPRVLALCRALLRGTPDRRMGRRRAERRVHRARPASRLSRGRVLHRAWSARTGDAGPVSRTVAATRVARGRVGGDCLESVPGFLRRTHRRTLTYGTAKGVPLATPRRKRVLSGAERTQADITQELVPNRKRFSSLRTPCILFYASSVFSRSEGVESWRGHSLCSGRPPDFGPGCHPQRGPRPACCSTRCSLAAPSRRPTPLSSCVGCSVATTQPIGLP